MTTEHTKTLSDGTRVHVTATNEQKYWRGQRHQCKYPPETIPGDKGIKCERCGYSDKHKIHGGAKGMPVPKDERNE